ncbi:hypothetical protein PUN28_014517 [Cardiocondyla obscurior]|uniref:Odorant receptor n=1 Tax=Cardiocondyla obscurior TaxID=286306 RepID=A0AAW2F4Q7_9HYME
MICIESQYFNINRILLLTIGLWPHQQSRLTQFQFFSLFFIILTGIIFQLTTFLTMTKYTSYLIIKVLSSTSFLIICLLKYYTFYINVEVVKQMLLDLQHMCDELRDKNEIAIIEKYGYTAKCYTVAFIGIAVSAASFLFYTQMYIMYDNALLKNVTSLHHLLFQTEYFINENNYMFFILLHMDMALSISTITMVATAAIFNACFKIFCGMFQISSYRIERAVKINILQNVALKNKICKSEELICAVNIHRQVLKSVYLFYNSTYIVQCNKITIFFLSLTATFLDKFEMMFFFLAGLFVFSLSFNFLQISQTILAHKTFKEAVLSFLIACVNIIYLFVANLLGQNMTDYNNDVFNTVYNVEWYKTPLQMQRTMLFLLIKGAKNFTLNIGGLFISSLEKKRKKNVTQILQRINRKEEGTIVVNFYMTSRILIVMRKSFI